MHPTAYENCIKFYNKYVLPMINSGVFLKVIDFGAYDCNGCLRPIFKGCEYKGLDMSAGPNVDIVSIGDKTPLEDKSVDIITSSSNFEHDDCFWMTFLEMCRILKPGGLIYINAPSTGPYHGFPGDCWRFYADSWKGLAKWANKNGYTIEVLESHIDSGTYWCDSVGIFKKNN
jgi:hypothetical protein